VRGRLTGAKPGAAARANSVRAVLARPDRRLDFATWVRMIVEDMLVIDAASIYPLFAFRRALFAGCGGRRDDQAADR